jgi:Tfp pilus assembly protein FimT
MKVKLRQTGLTLTEMTVVIATIALLTVFGIPAIRAFVKSFETEAGVRGMINAALSNARAIAAREQKYSGVRFQQKWEGVNKEGCQYMIFIIHDKQNTGLANGFRAVAGAKPLKLPDNIGVMDLRNRTNYEDTREAPGDSDDRAISGFDDRIDDPEELRDTTTFSSVFSPSGKLMIYDVRVRNRDDKFRPVNLNESRDDIFNSPVNIEVNNTGMFVQDDYAHLGLGQEPSRREFIIYDRGVFDKVNDDRRWTDYLKDLKDTKIHINPYTGRMID